MSCMLVKIQLRTDYNLQYIRLSGHELRTSYQPLCPRVSEQARSHPRPPSSRFQPRSKPPLLLNEFKHGPCWRNVHARRAMRQKFLRVAAAVSLQLVWTEIHNEQVTGRMLGALRPHADSLLLCFSFLLPRPRLFILSLSSQ